MEGYRPGRLLHRSIAYLIDRAIWTLLWLFILAYYDIFSQIQRAFREQSLLTVQIPWSAFRWHLLLGILYIWLLKRFGTSPGKFMLGLTVLSRQNGNMGLNWKQVIVRFVTTNIVAKQIINIPEAIAFFRKDRLQLADLIAKTQVMQPGDQELKLKPRFILGSLLILIGVSSTIKNLNKIPITPEGYRLVHDFRPNKDAV